MFPFLAGYAIAGLFQLDNACDRACAAAGGLEGGREGNTNRAVTAG